MQTGDLVGMIGEHRITAAIPGIVRGLIMPGSYVTTGQKLGDIDPRGDTSFCHTLSDKTRTISGATLEIIVSFFNDR